MRKDVGVDGDAQRIGQLVWLFFLKIWDDRERELELIEDGFQSPLVNVRWRDNGEERTAEDLRWRTWAADPEGMTGDDLLNFLNSTLFTALKSLDPGPRIEVRDESSRASHSLHRRKTLVRSVFEDAYQYMKSGTLVRQVVNHVQSGLDFNDTSSRHLFGDVYEQVLQGLQGAGDAGEYYTPRAVTRAVVDVLNPTLGEVFLDPACGTGGFLTGAIEHVRKNEVRTAKQEAELHTCVRGVEKKPLPHLLCTTNLIVHGIDVPAGVRRDNALTKPPRDISARDRVDIILTNPPFQGKEEGGIENNFPLEWRTRETADLFLGLVVELLRDGGRAAIVLPDSSLFGEGITEALRRKLLSECKLRIVLRLPHGVFSPYTDIRTNVLFFEKGAPTEDVWFYEHTCPSGAKYTKTKPIQRKHLDEFVAWALSPADSDHAWRVEIKEVLDRGASLDWQNPLETDSARLLSVGLTSLESSTQELSQLRTRLWDTRKCGKAQLGPRAQQLVRHMIQVADTVPLTSGITEDLRCAATELALQGELTASARGDESVNDTIARFSPSGRPLPKGSSDDHPFPVPKHWKWVRLGDISDFRIGRTPSTRNHNFWTTTDDEKGIFWISISDMDRRSRVTATKRCITALAAEEAFGAPPVMVGALLVAFKLSIGKTAISGVEGYHNEAIASFEIRDEVLRDYLLWAIPALATHGASNPAVRGATLNSKSIAALWIPIPPRQEQARLTSALSSVAAQIDEVAAVAGVKREAADRVLKLVARRRALSCSTFAEGSEPVQAVSAP